MEYYKDLAFPTASLVFCLLGVPVGIASKRSGRIGGFAVGVLVIIVVLHVECRLRIPGHDGESAALCRGLVTEWHFHSHHHRLVLYHESPVTAMPILFRYLLREYGKIFTMCFSGLMTIYLVIDFFEKVRRFLRYDADWLDVLTYFLLKTPAISFQIAPLAILMATLLTFGLLSRGHEITAMRSCGISLLWITSPFIVFAAGISLVLLLFSSTIIPLAASKSEEIRTTRIEKKPPAAAVKLEQPWTRVGADSLMHVTSVSVGGELLGGVRLFQFDRNFQLADSD